MPAPTSADTFSLDPDAILRQPLAQVLPALSAEFEADLADPPQAGSTRTLRTVRVGTSEGVLPYEAAISRSGECAIIELEAPPSGALSSIDMLYPNPAPVRGSAAGRPPPSTVCAGSRRTTSAA
jgi:hypothetical protein